MPSAYKNLTASGVVKGRNGVLKGATVSASSSGTLTVYDNASAASGTIILGPVSLIAGQVIHLYDGIRVSNGIYAAIGGTSATVNVLYE